MGKNRVTQLGWPLDSLPDESVLEEGVFNVDPEVGLFAEEVWSWLGSHEMAWTVLLGRKSRGNSTSWLGQISKL